MSHKCMNVECRNMVHATPWWEMKNEGKKNGI